MRRSLRTRAGIGLQFDALEKGIEPELVAHRIAQLRAEKEAAEAELEAARYERGRW